MIYLLDCFVQRGVAVVVPAVDVDTRCSETSGKTDKVSRLGGPVHRCLSILIPLVNFFYVHLQLQQLELVILPH